MKAKNSPGSHAEARPVKSGDQSDAPKNKPSMQHKEPSRPVQAGDQSAAPSHKKAALPMQDAPPGVSSVNGGTSMALPQGGGPGESKV